MYLPPRTPPLDFRVEAGHQNANAKPLQLRWVHLTAGNHLPQSTLGDPNVFLLASSHSILLFHPSTALDYLYEEALSTVQITLVSYSDGGSVCVPHHEGGYQGTPHRPASRSARGIRLMLSTGVERSPEELGPL
jgi:hypothetical protein